MGKSLIAVAMLAAGFAPSVSASSSVTVQVSASVRAVQCTPEQQARIRACATGSQSIAIVPFKRVSTLQASPQSPAAQQVEIDPARRVLVRTILY